MSRQPVGFKHILVPTDFGDAAGRAVDVAVDLAKKYSATITLLHVYELPVYPYPEISVLPDIDFITPIREAAQKELSKAFAVVQRSGCEARAQLSCGVVWTEILQEAEQARADLIVMGTHGRRGMVHALLGSVAEKIVRTANVPVLTVRSAPPAKT
jgi:nucleotide-binding universal stress UspA family protein